MRNVLKSAKYLIVGLYVICGILLAVFLLPKTGWKALSVATGSMNPAIPQGSLVIIRNTSYRDIHGGDVITFVNPQNSRQTITHRVVETKQVSGLPGFVTKGDANKVTDSAIIDGSVVGKVVWHAPSLGRWMDALKQPIWIILLVGIPGLLIIIDELRRLVKVLVADEAKKLDTTNEPVVEIEKTEPVRQPVVLRQKRRGIVRLGLLLVLIAGVIGSTRAQLVSKATLTGNTISTAALSGNTGGGACSGGSSTISVTNTGPGSTNNANVTNNCNNSSTNTNTVTVTNTTTQTATSGSANSSGNTNSGPPISGAAANGSSSVTTIQTSNY